MHVACVDMSDVVFRYVAKYMAITMNKTQANRQLNFANQSQITITKETVYM